MLFIRLKTFIKSLFWHIQRGLPKSNQSTIDHRYQICISCDQFDNKHHQCTMCGCNINNKKIFLNKLAWADQRCPLNKWSNVTD